MLKSFRPFVIVVLMLAALLSLGISSGIRDRVWIQVRYTEESASQGEIIHIQTGGSIQEAIDSAQAGSVIVLEGGVWQEHVTVNKALLIHGQGPKVTSIKPVMEETPVLQVLGEGEQPISVTLVGISLTGAHGECNDYHRPCSSGLMVRGNASLVVIDCELSGNTRGIELFGEARATIIRGRINGNYQAGLLANDDVAAVLIDCEIGQNARHGVRLRGDAQVTLHQCRLAGNSTGVFLWDSSTVTLQSCRIEGEEGRGVGLWLVQDSQAVVEDTRISDCGAGIAVGEMSIVHLNDVEISTCQVGITQFIRYCGFTFAPCCFDGQVKGNVGFSGNELDLCPPKPEEWEGLTIEVVGSETGEE